MATLDGLDSFLSFTHEAHRLSLVTFDFLMDFLRAAVE